MTAHPDVKGSLEGDSQAGSRKEKFRQAFLFEFQGFTGFQRNTILKRNVAEIAVAYFIDVEPSLVKSESM